MKLLVLCDIVEEFDLYELMVLCVIGNKYMVMLYGMFEFKYFFLCKLEVVGKGVCLVLVVKVLICDMIVVEW